MPKKTDSTTKPTVPAPAAPEASTPALAPVKRAVKPTVKAKTVAKKPKAPAVKAKRTTAKAAPAPATPAAPSVPTFTREDVALRAYFISEKRRHHGLPGDEHQDWVEAERQLLAESAKPKKAKKTA